MQEQDVGDAKLVTQVCRLSFSDGQFVTAQICAGSRYDECPVQYAGAVERLPFVFEKADSVLLCAFFQSFARELKARFSEELTGDWPHVQTPYDAEENAPEVTENGREAASEGGCQEKGTGRHDSEPVGEG